jgi:hypothetical protein
VGQAAACLVAVCLQCSLEKRPAACLRECLAAMSVTVVAEALAALAAEAQQQNMCGTLCCCCCRCDAVQRADELYTHCIASTCFVGPIYCVVVGTASLLLCTKDWIDLRTGKTTAQQTKGCTFNHDHSRFKKWICACSGVLSSAACLRSVPRL